MSDTSKGMMTIRYVNGNENRFEFTRVDDTMNVATRIKEVLSANQIMLELEDRVLIIPLQNDQIIEVSPSLEKLPPNVMRNVRLVS